MQTSMWRGGRLLGVVGVVLVLGCAAKKGEEARSSAKPLRVLFVYGGVHHSSIEPYMRMLDSMDGVEWTTALLPQSVDMLKPGLQKEYDALRIVHQGLQWVAGQTK
ncbi:MAG: hypothetical protein ACYS9X_15500 [Planctomycetota bacterium]|jgi:hypothetical protein